MIYFISDTHFGHANIIKSCDRPFASVEEMNETMIELWNARVRNEDEVYILGDMFFRCKDPEPILKRLKGKKYLIIGNHDHTWLNKIPTEKYFEWVQLYADVQIGGERAVLSHYPMLSYRNDSKRYMIHGHLHNNCGADFWPLLAKRDRIFNAGVELNGYQPVTLPELIDNNGVFKAFHSPFEENNITPLSELFGISDDE